MATRTSVWLHKIMHATSFLWEKKSSSNVIIYISYKRMILQLIFNSFYMFCIINNKYVMA